MCMRRIWLFRLDLIWRSTDGRLGTSALWDNRVSQHCALWDYAGEEPRHGTRVKLWATGTYCRTGASSSSSLAYHRSVKNDYQQSLNPSKQIIADEAVTESPANINLCLHTFFNPVGK
jgi:hypothetical protein